MKTMIITRTGNLMKHVGVISICLLATLATDTANATPLDLYLMKSPDIFSHFINASYDADSDLFIAKGWAAALDDGGPGPSWPIDGGIFDITAKIDESGASSQGSLMIGGTVSGLGFTSGTLLYGELTAFGFTDVPGGGGPLEYLFNITGGDAAGLYGGIAGVILSYGGFDGHFYSDFSNLPFSGVSDTGIPAPEPASIILLLSGAGILVVLRNRIRIK